ncbi:hypothetical protein ABTZ59_28075 [Streptomyces sp. NPDC094034]|uniref:hypothetical protein n=1 Tax=Streptomyces sp. NPDC094034 TaxID=3155309 RepID=UPI00331F1308
MSRRHARRCMTALLGGSLVFIAPPVPATAAEEVAVPIANADVAEPELTTATPATKTPDRWTGAQVQHFPKGLAGHPDGLQAVSLNQTGPGTLTTRLWRVQKGSKVTLNWDDSPSTHADCKQNEVGDGQRYEVVAPGAGPNSPAPVPFTTKGTDKGKANWQSGRSYSFTAEESNPKVTFTSKQPDKASKCGPLLTRFRAQQEPAPVPYKDKKPQLPLPQAYKNHEPVPPKDVVTACNSADACRFEKDERYSFQYYDRPRMVGQAYINCTRNAVTDDRPVEWQEYPYDNLTQYFVDVEKKPLNPRQPLNESLKEIAVQIAGGFTRADGNPLEMATTNPLLWNRKEQRKLAVTVQPGEVSWIEVQPARERITGTLVKTPDLRLDVTVDIPSGAFGDRFYQRTGPLSKVELARCADARYNARTPDETIGAPTLRAGNPVAGLLPVAARPSDAGTRVRPVTPVAESRTR